MRTRQAATIGLLIAALMVPASAAETKTGRGAEPKSHPPALAHTTIIKGSRSAVMPVELPRPVFFSTGSHPQLGWPNDILSVTGRGRIFGVVLRSATRKTAGLLEVLVPGYCARPACDPVFDPTVHRGIHNSTVYPPARDSDGNEYPTAGTLPAGRYHLYLIADGAPVRVKLRFRGLSGHTELTPTTPAPVRIVEAEPDTDIPSEPTPGVPIKSTAYSGGDTHRISAPGFSFLLSMWKWVLPPGAISEANVCAYSGRPPPAPAGAVSPYQWCMKDYLPFDVGTGETARTWGPGGAFGLRISTLDALAAFDLERDRDRLVLSLGAYMDTVGATLDAHIMILWVNWLDP